MSKKIRSLVHGKSVLVALLGLFVLFPLVSVAQETGPVTDLPMPRFVSLKSNEINMRRGPGLQYPIDWVYRRKHLPVEVVAEFENWRKIKDWEGETGWVYHSLLSGRRTVRVMTETTALKEKADNGSETVAWLERGVLGLIESCSGTWCLVNVQGHKGYLSSPGLYGRYKDEEIE
jgi:SH3-like domain-containing protein